MQTDPVCGMQIDARQAVAKSEYLGKTFNFCSQPCKQQFDQNPERYAGQKAATSDNR